MDPKIVSVLGIKRNQDKRLRGSHGTASQGATTREKVHDGARDHAARLPGIIHAGRDADVQHRHKATGSVWFVGVWYAGARGRGSRSQGRKDRSRRPRRVIPTVCVVCGVHLCALMFARCHAIEYDVAAIDIRLAAYLRPVLHLRHEVNADRVHLAHICRQLPQAQVALDAHHDRIAGKRGDFDPLGVLPCVPEP